MVGRKNEIERLHEAYKSDHSQFIAVYGRRRVGKTFLIREAFDYTFSFQHVGRVSGSREEQLLYFRDSLVDSGHTECPMLKSWREAFRELQKLLEVSKDKRKVVFIDELPYMATHKSDMVGALEHFWNGWCSARKDILLIICGSSASWLLKKIIRDKGGLHNRVTGQIHLSPFTLAECEEYVKAKGLKYTKRQIAECYMILGGIPYYWDYLRKGKSIPQCIDEMFFSRDGGLRNEYEELFRSLFESPEPYMEIVSALGESGTGMTRDELAKKLKQTSCGPFSNKLDDLEKCGFIEKFRTFGLSKNGGSYRLMDNFTLFYFKFMWKNCDHDERFWSNNAKTPMFFAWSGYAFERLCVQHLSQIKAALGISGVKSSISVWRHRPDDECPLGAQIDLVIDRDDGIINLCEMKFSKSEFIVTKKYNAELDAREACFAAVTKSRKTLHRTFITAEGVFENEYSDDIQSKVQLEDLFKR